MTLYINTIQFGEIVGVSDETVRAHIKAGRIVASDVGTGRKSQYRIHKDEVERFMESRRVTPKTPTPRRRQRAVKVKDYLGLGVE